MGLRDYSVLTRQSHCVIAVAPMSRPGVNSDESGCHLSVIFNQRSAIMPNSEPTQKPKAAHSQASVPAPDVPSVTAFLFGWNMEMAQFYFRRYQQYWTSPAKFLACQSVEELRAVQAEFLQQLMADYRENAVRLSQIANGSTSTADFDTAYEARLLKAQEDAAAIIEQARAQARRILESVQKQVDKNEALPRPEQAKKQA